VAYQCFSFVKTALLASITTTLLRDVASLSDNTVVARAVETDTSSVRVSKINDINKFSTPRTRPVEVASVEGRCVGGSHDIALSRRTKVLSDCTFAALDRTVDASECSVGCFVNPADLPND